MTSPPLLSPLTAVVFDVGETLVDESGQWTRQAVAAGVTPFTLMGLIGALIDRGENHDRVWQILNVDPPSAPPIEATDLYPDAVDCLRSARAAGLLVGIAGNQPDGAVEQLSRLGFTADFIASSASWRVRKPDPRFFQRILEQIGHAPETVMYVGDRLDNDVLPARAVGMRTVLVRRGPWGHLHATRPHAAHADLVVASLAELAAQFANLATSSAGASKLTPQTPRRDPRGA